MTKPSLGNAIYLRLTFVGVCSMIVRLMGEHPELAGTYLNLRAAELAARALRDPQDQKRFIAQVRSALADDIERGEPLQPVRLKSLREPNREPNHVRS